MGVIKAIPTRQSILVNGTCCNNDDSMLGYRRWWPCNTSTYISIFYSKIYKKVHGKHNISFYLRLGNSCWISRYKWRILFKSMISSIFFHLIFAHNLLGVLVRLGYILNNNNTRLLINIINNYCWVMEALYLPILWPPPPPSPQNKKGKIKWF